MQEFLITLDIMLPLLLLLALGYLLRRLGLMKEQVAAGINQLVFRLFLPMLIFNNIRTLNTQNAPNPAISLFIIASILCIFTLARLLVPRFVRDPRKSGVMMQGLFRTNFAILGTSLITAMFGEEGLTTFALVTPIVVPLFNILAVIALSTTGGKVSVKKLVLQIIRNPLIIAVALGMVFLVLDISLPQAADKVCSQLAGLVSPLSLLVLGASLRWQGVKDNRKELCITLLLKQLIIPFTMLACAILLGFQGVELGVLIVLYGAPIAVSSYPMAVAMGGDDALAAGLLVLSTIISMGTLFALIYASKLLGVL